MLAALASSLLALTVVVVPLDDRPVTAQLPVLLGAIAGVRVAEPPPALLGRYLRPGDPDAILRWLRTDAPRDARAYVVSNDMIAYGGLVASRIPQTSGAQAEARVAALAAFRLTHGDASFALFGTVMRLAPTGIPALGDAASFPFAGEVWPRLQQYANLPDPPLTDADRATAARLRAQLGPDLEAYLAARARDRDVDLFALGEAAQGRFDRVVLGQDDAGPVGLHLRDLAALRAYAARWVPPGRAAIEPGADELGMALLAAALARQAAFVPRVRVIYSRADGGGVNDPIEFAPVATSIGSLIRTCGAVEVDAPDAPADVELFVKVPATGEADEHAFVDRIAHDATAAGAPLAALADLSFLVADDYAQQRQLMRDLIARGVAGRVGAFASWNTVANTVGTTLPEAIAVLAGKRMGTYDPTAHARFTLMRYVDDIAFHDDVRPRLNTDLDAQGVDDHTYLLPGTAGATADENRTLLWRDGLALLHQIEPQFRDAGFTITLPWDRTFETELDLRLTPNL
ncbi:MAG TPA: DUF4127 family protein [Candidatus Sulfotelmatobacter sp.]|nr:DUF4127 family protein [Candidatus Sulfotelmatobacter sp.]